MVEIVGAGALSTASIQLSEDDPLLTSKDVIADLRSVGLPISPSWFEKLREADKGPPVECYWGRRPMWKRSRVRAWAEERMRATMPDQAA